MTWQQFMVLVMFNPTGYVAACFCLIAYRLGYWRGHRAQMTVGVEHQRKKERRERIPSDWIAERIITDPPPPPVRRRDEPRGHQPSGPPVDWLRVAPPAQRALARDDQQEWPNLEGEQ